MGLLCRFLVRGRGERECCLDPTGSELHARPPKNLPVTIRTAGQDDSGIQPKGYCGSFVTVKVRSRSFSKGFVWARLPQDDGTWQGRLPKNNQTTQRPFIVPCEDTFGHCTPMYPRMICSWKERNAFFPSSYNTGMCTPAVNMLGPPSMQWSHQHPRK